jgi:DNA-directed RNA polymerase subunit L
MNIRLQTTEGNTAVEVLKDGLADLEEICNLIDEEFTAALDRFKERSKS